MYENDFVNDDDLNEEEKMHQTDTACTYADDITITAPHTDINIAKANI